MTPIQTTYKGIKFRSRTEARWAAFFENLGVRWNYEPEGFSLPSGRYLPDFFLPDFDRWFEVKPDETDESERPVFAELCAASGKHGIIAYGPPVASRQNLFTCAPDNGEFYGPYTLAQDRRDDGVYWLANDTGWFVIGGPGTVTDHDKPPMLLDHICAAFAAAQAERFGVHE